MAGNKKQTMCPGKELTDVKCSCGCQSRREFLSDSVRQITVLASGSALLSLVGACGGGGYGGSSTPTSPDTGGNNSGGGGGGGGIQIDISQSQFSALATVGGKVALNANAASGLPANGVFIIRSSETLVIVLSRTCTHMGCQVGAFNSAGIAECPCHGSRYDTSGNVVRGPAPAALKKYSATISGNIITITV